MILSAMARGRQKLQLRKPPPSPDGSTCQMIGMGSQAVTLNYHLYSAPVRSTSVTDCSGHVICVAIED